MLNLLIKPAWLFVDFLVQDKIGHVNYGNYAALFSLSYLFINIADFGVNTLVTRRLTLNRESLQTIYPNAFSLKLLACIVYPVIISSVGYIIGYRGENIYFLFVLSLVQSILQAVAFFRANFQALHFFNIDSVISITDKSLLLIITLILFVVGVNLFLFVHAILLSVILTAIIALVFLIRIQGWMAPKFEGAIMKDILKHSFPFAMIGILFAINQKVDMVMVERLGGEKGAENAGIYAAAYRWMDAFMMYLWTTLPIFFAKFSSHQFEPKENQKLFDLGQIVSFIPTLFIGVVVLFYGEHFFWMFKHSTREEIVLMSKIMKILFVSLIVQGLFAIYGTLLNSTGHEKNVSWMIVICLIMNVSLNFLFIPQFGPIAAAYISLLSTSLICLMYLIYFERKTQLVIPYSILKKLVIISLAFSFSFYLLTLTNLHWLIISCLAGIILLGISFLMNLGEIQGLIRKK